MPKKVKLLIFSDLFKNVTKNVTKKNPAIINDWKSIGYKQKMHFCVVPTRIELVSKV